MTIVDLYEKLSQLETINKETLDALLSEDTDGDGEAPRLFARVAPEQEHKALSFIKELLESTPEQREYGWEKILALLEPGRIPDELLAYFLRENIALLTLGHMDLPDRWLLKLGKHVEEALFTLGKRMYGTGSYAASDFARFLSENHSDALLTQLLQMPVASGTKRSCLVFACRQYASDDVRQFCASIVRREKLLLSEDPHELENAYRDCADEMVLLSLAQNVFTPEYILVSLKGVSNHKNARAIRIAAESTLRAIERFKNHA